MAVKAPLVIGTDGNMERLQPGDSIDVGSSVGGYSADNGNDGSITIGQVVYISGSGEMDLAKADNGASAAAHALVVDASVSSGATGNFKLSGIVTSTDWTTVTGSEALTAGAMYFVSDSEAGGLTSVAPTTAGSYVVPVGRALSATELDVNIGTPIKL